MKSILASILVSFALLVSFSCSSPTCDTESTVLAYAQPETVQISSERLDRIDGVIQAGIDSGYVKGMAAMIVRKGKIVYHKSFGHTDEASSLALEQDAIFRIASQTKAITSVAAMMLFEEGKFLLDDKLSDYLPEFKNITVLQSFNGADSSYTSQPASNPIRIRQLLTHTSGLDYTGFGNDTLRSIYAKNGLPAIFGSDKDKLSDFSSRLAQMPLHHEPGKYFTYGHNTDILGRLVEVLSGQTLDVFFRTRIFEPLGMADTYFYLPEDKKARLVPVFVKEEGQLVEFHGLDEYGVGLDYPLSNGTFHSGGAGLSSTLMDYGIFLQMMLNGGEYNGNRLLSRRTVELMTSHQLGDLTLGKDTFGLGFRVKTEAGQQELGESKGSFSWGGYYGTQYWADPKEEIIGLIFANQRKGIRGNIHNKFKAMVYASLDD